VNPENIPEPLRSSKRWVCFQVQPQPDGSTKKFPMTATGRPARSDHREDWYRLPDVLHAISFCIGQYPAIALGEDYPLRVLDLDDCILPDGSLSLLAQTILKLAPGAYVERSVSGRGLHVLVWTSNVRLPTHPCPGLEVYGGAPRFIIITGDLWQR